MEPTELEICFGSIHNATAKVIGRLSVAHAPSMDSFYFFDVRHFDGVFEILNDRKEKFAVLDTYTTSKLQALRRVRQVRFEAVVQKKIFAKRKTSSKSPLALSINTLGPHNEAENVIQALRKMNEFLQHPHALGGQIKYDNPDMLIFPGYEPDMSLYVGSNISDGDMDRLNREFQTILDSLGRVTNGTELGPLNGMISVLTPHQSDGVRFILQRENPETTRQLGTRMSQAIGAGTLATGGYSATMGGLLADVMGLGKTLTMLSSILHTLGESQDFVLSPPSANAFGVGMDVTKATLIILPSVQLIESWESEISRHFSANTLNLVRFHGANRPRTVHELRKYNIVLTTYQTAASDFASNGLLYRLEWYRIVLDEAHWIRNSSSRQFKSVCALQTQRRWCLSGTPVQNKVEDFASLAYFLRLGPIDSKYMFQKHILGPLSKDLRNITPLRTFMEAYCLRRTESCLTLPTSREEIRSLRFSPQERALYDQIKSRTRAQMEEAVNTGQTNRCTELFQLLLRLRMVCNSGAFGLSSAPLTASQGVESRLEVSDGGIAGCESCTRSNEDSRMLLSGLAVCPDCGRPLQDNSPSPLPSTSSFVTCDAENMAQWVASDCVGNAVQGSHSTKLNAVLENIVSTTTSEDKAIIFSYWRSTLVLLAQLLHGRGIAYVQVDGHTTYAERSSRFRAFKEEPSIQVLLMTTGTGAVGLNLTVASRIHIVEPQWNPSVEEQAIARAVRMGQTREVVIFRYVIHSTVEQNVMRLQEKKRKVAKFMLGTGADTTLSGAVEELETVLDLYPLKRGVDEVCQ